MVRDDDEVMWRVKEALERSPGTNMTTIAAQLGMDRHSLGRALRRAAGTTFRQLSSDAKLRHVRVVMCGGRTESIKAAAYSMGYRSPASLTRFVRGRCGCTPTDLRAFHGRRGEAS